MRLWRRPAVRWTVLALLGVVIATAVTIAATRLVGQHVALGGESRLTDRLVVAPPPTSTSPATTQPPPFTTLTTVTTTRSPEPPRPDEHEHDDDEDDD
jgi:hypothetical protein